MTTGFGLLPVLALALAQVAAPIAAARHRSEELAPVVAPAPPEAQMPPRLALAAANDNEPGGQQRPYAFSHPGKRQRAAERYFEYLGLPAGTPA